MFYKSYLLAGTIGFKATAGSKLFFVARLCVHKPKRPPATISKKNKKTGKSATLLEASVLISTPLAVLILVLVLVIVVSVLVLIVL